MLDNWCLFINLVVLSYGLYSLLMWPINTRLHVALSHIFGKEIARSLFQKLHPDFTYKKYTSDEHLHQIIFNSALEEFTRLRDKENTHQNEEFLRKGDVMNNQRYYPGPYWTMNSSEAGASFLLVCFILTIPALPTGMFGWFMGEHMIGNNFAKWGFMILFFVVMYLFVLYIRNTKGLWYAIFVVFLEYFIWDYSSMIYYEKDALVMQKLMHALLEWGLHMQ